MKEFDNSEKIVTTSRGFIIYSIYLFVWNYFEFLMAVSRKTKISPVLSKALYFTLIFCSVSLWMISLSDKTNYSFCSDDGKVKGQAFVAG